MDFSGSDRLPLLNSLTQCFHLYRPVMQGCWVEVRTVRPNQRVNLRVDSDTVKEVHVVEVWDVVLCTNLHEHSDDDAKEAAQFRHTRILHFSSARD